jgi:hypothetical protein
MKTVASHFKCFFTIYGVKIGITTEDEHTKEYVTSFLKGFPSSSSPSNSDLGIELNLFTSARFPRGPLIPSSAEQVSASRLPLAMYRTNDKCYLVFKSSWLCLSLKDRVGIGVFDEGIWSYHWIILQHFFLSGLCLLLRACGRYLIHAAGVEHDGKGYLILGKSGSGKSTTTLSLVGQGWKYLGDDALLLHQMDSQIEAFGIPVDFKADDHTIHKLLRGIKDDFAVKIPRYDNFPYFSKRYLMIDQLYPNQFTARCFPDYLLFAQPTSQEKSEFVPMRKSEAFKGVIEASPHFSLDSNYVELLSALVRQTNAYQLLAGKDVFDNPRGFEEILLNGCQEKF